MSDMAGLADLVHQIKDVSASIAQSDDKFTHRLAGVEANVNELYRKTSRPGAESGDVGFERKEAREFCKQRHDLTANKVEEFEYSPSSAEVDLAVNAQRGLKAYLRHGDLNRLSTEHRKGLSAFSFGPPGNFLLPPTQANRVLSCLVYPTNLSGLVDKVTISGPSLVFMIDQVRFQMGAWSCDSSCFSNNELAVPFRPVEALAQGQEPGGPGGAARGGGRVGALTLGLRLRGLINGSAKVQRDGYDSRR